MLTERSTAGLLGLFGGRPLDISWPTPGVIAITGVVAIIYARRKDMGTSTQVAIAVIVGLYLAFELSKLL